MEPAGDNERAPVIISSLLGRLTSSPSLSLSFSLSSLLSLFSFIFCCFSFCHATSRRTCQSGNRAGALENGATAMKRGSCRHPANKYAPCCLVCLQRPASAVPWRIWRAWPAPELASSASPPKHNTWVNSNDVILISPPNSAHSPVAHPIL